MALIDDPAVLAAIEATLAASAVAVVSLVRLNRGTCREINAEPAARHEKGDAP